MSSAPSWSSSTVSQTTLGVQAELSIILEPMREEAANETRELTGLARGLIQPLKKDEGNLAVAHEDLERAPLEEGTSVIELGETREECRRVKAARAAEILDQEQKTQKSSRALDDAHRQLEEAKFELAKAREDLS